MTLLDLQQGERAVITKVKGRGAFRKRIMEMGFIAGKEIIVGKKAPLKNPVEYTVMGYNVSLRNSEAGLIEVSQNNIAKAGTNGYEGVIVDPDQKKSLSNGKKHINIALIGNPNCGKTTLFNFASKSREKVGNYSGVTVDAKKASFNYKDYAFDLIDLPGTYSLTYYSPEELFVRNYLFEEVPDLVINVVDSSNLERNLFLTTQLIDLDIKVVMALNMYDELTSKGDQFDYDALGRMIGIPVVPTVSSRGKGIRNLFDKAIDVFEDRDPDVRHVHINYGQDIENAIKRIQEKIKIEENKKITNIIAPRFLAIKLMENDREERIRIRSCVNHEEIFGEVKTQLALIEEHFKENTETVITNQRYGFVDGALKETFVQSPKDIRSLSRFVDRFLTNKYLSYPIFIFFMWVMFQATFSLGQYPMDGIEYLVDRLGIFMHNQLPEGLFRDMLVQGVIDGVGGVVVFLPNILILFFFISIMEDTGYMARVAFIVDKLMHKIGLHGRSFIPMLMGFGCNVPAIMATRTIGGKNDRLVTMLINPFMSCSARLPVYVLIIGATFPRYPGLVLFSVYAIGIILAVIIAIIFKKTLFKAREMPFVMELPPYRVPTTKAIFRHTWYKGSQYLKKMGGVILIASIIIWALGYFPRTNPEVLALEEKIEQARAANIEHVTDLQMEKARVQQESSFIGRIGKFVEPVIYPLGFDWRMGVSLVSGIAAKEVVVSTFGVLYQENPDEEAETGLTDKLKKQRYESGPRKGQKVFTPLASYSFLMFILIYFPCIAVIVAIKKESGGWKWAVFMAVYTTTLAWVVSFLVYQVGSLIV
ncbi:MAG: ferrous iron transport protein B [Bacteroidales bacterium]|nr:ferrous iron transport protein B [Bacteroidales bacterium]MCF8398567.1 ferrous iron transport protein B [Bacteroidales bacterium]